MGLSNVEITVSRDGLGLVAMQNDGIAGMALKGVAVPGKLELAKAYLITKLAEAEGKGITAEGDNKSVHRQISEFYQLAGEEAKLYFTVVDTEATTVDLEAALRKVLELANGEITLLGVSLSESKTSSVAQGGLTKEVFDTQIMLQQLAEEYTHRIMPFIGIIGGAGFKGDTTALTNLTTLSNFRTVITLTASDKNGAAAVGQLLAAIVTQPVHRKISRVKNGALPISEGYLTDGASIAGRETALGEMSDKGYIVYRTFPGRSGYFYNSDATATLPTDDLCSMARLRVMDKALKIAYNTYINELDDEIDITPDGKLDPAKISYLQELIINQVTGNMDREISSFQARIDPSQNILSGRGIKILLSITPKGYLNPINVSLGFVNPAK